MFVKQLDNLLDNLRRRPEQRRKHYALIISVALTFIVFIIWLATFSLESVGVSRIGAVGDSSPLATGGIYENIVIGMRIVRDWVFSIARTIKNIF